jgi:hypothetical protein
MCDDLFLEDEAEDRHVLHANEWKKLSADLELDGFRDGLDKAKGPCLQKGFEDGLRHSFPPFFRLNTLLGILSVLEARLRRPLVSGNSPTLVESHSMEGTLEAVTGLSRRLRSLSSDLLQSQDIEDCSVTGEKEAGLSSRFEDMKSQLQAICSQLRLQSLVKSIEDMPPLMG